MRRRCIGINRILFTALLDYGVKPELVLAAYFKSMRRLMIVGCCLDQGPRARYQALDQVVFSLCLERHWCDLSFA